LQQARRPSPFNRATRSSGAGGTRESRVRLNDTNRYLYPNADALRLSRGTLAPKVHEPDTEVPPDDAQEAIPDTPTPASKTITERGAGPGGSQAKRPTEAAPESQNEYVSAAEKDPSGSEEERSQTDGPNREQSTQSAIGRLDTPKDTQEAVMKQLSFKKKADDSVHDENITATQAVRQVELKQARMQYIEVKELYQKTKDGVDALEASAASGAIDKALHLSRLYLAELEATMKEDEQRLLDALSSAHPEVVVVPTSVHHINRFQTSIVADPDNGAKAGSKRKAQGRSGDGPSKRPKDAEVLKYLDLEAKESNKDEASTTGGGTRSGRGRIKSRAIVTQSDDEWASRPQEVNLRDVIEGRSTERRAGKEKEEGEDKVKDGEYLPEDDKCIFHVEKPDLSEVLKDPTPNEVLDIKQLRDDIKSSQFNWGDVLTICVCNVIRTWCYDSRSTLDKPKPEDLTPHLMYIRALVEDRDMMNLRLQTSPRLMQVSSLDPFVTTSCLNWDIIQRSTLYPWSKKNGLFRALHVMTVRTDRDPEWTSHSVVKCHISAGYSILHNILADALKIVSFKNDHGSINIRQEGEDGVADAMVEQAKTMTWLARQCFVGEEDSAPKRGRIANATVRSLQKKFFHVLLGVNIVFESEVHNGLLMKAEKRGETVRKLKSMKANQKSESVLYQLMNDRNKHETYRVKSIAASKSSKQVASGSATPSQSASTTDREKSLSAKNSRDVADFKKECLQYLSLFLMYGTAAFFHVWPAYKDQSMPESAMLIHLASLVCDRRYERCGYEAHVFGARAWNRLDELMFSSLRLFVTDAGTFRSDIKWADMTKHFYVEFDVKKLAGLFMLDLLTETHRPGLSVGLNGQVMEHIRVKDEHILKMNDPLSETFRAMWGPTEGPLLPVTDRGSSLYPEVDRLGNLKRPHNPQTQMAADQAKSNSKNDYLPSEYGSEEDVEEGEMEEEVEEGQSEYEEDEDA
ncbi:hypothetical protein DFH28DRAFT_1142564, partial [Melampsora americana]